MERVRNYTGERGDPDRRERCRRRVPRIPVEDQQEQRHDHEPAPDPEQRAEETRDKADEDESHGPYRSRVNLLTRLAEEPSRAAILLDVDGTLAPIVPRPEDARVPPETQAELRRLHARYGLVACVSGRAGDDARRVVGVPELVYVGNHGLELAPEAPVWAARLRQFLPRVDWPRIEDKGLSASLHYRDATDEEGAQAALAEVAAEARREGFTTRWGRKVLEVLPPLAADKGTAIRRLLEERRLDRAMRIAVASAEGPSALVDAADVVVTGPPELLELLREL